MTEKNNPFIANMSKYLKREITAHIYTNNKTTKITGLCEGIDYKNKAVIIRTNKETILIPRYLYITRKRLHPDQKDKT